MALRLRRRPRRKSPGQPSTRLALLGNVVLFLFTLAVGALVAYLVLYPPGVIQ